MGIRLFIKLLGLLPRSLVCSITASAGILFFIFSKRRRKICLTNLEQCFPDRSLGHRRLLATQCFWQVGYGFGEAISIWQSSGIPKFRVVVENRKAVTTAEASGKGILLICPHFSTLEVIAALLARDVHSLVMTYRPSENEVIEDILVSGRSRFGRLLPVRNIREILRSLRSGEAVWFGPDQDMGTKGSVLSSFFGRRAWTVTTPARMVELSGCVPIFVQVRRSAGTYYVKYTSFPENYPSSDQGWNADVLNLLIERAVSQCPSQYNWLHRRFKTNPDGSRHTLYRL